MKTLKFTIATIVLLFSFTNSFSQVALDTVYKKSGKTMIVKVTEVLPDMVKYIYHNGNDSIIMGIDRDELQKIAFANGAVQTFVETIINPENYANQHKRDLKIDFIAPMLGKTTIDYERSIKPGLSWEVGTTIVGLGINLNTSHTTEGAIFGGGIKFIHTPDFTSRGQHYTHILKGAYIKLQGYLGYYTDSYNSYYFATPYYYNPTQVKVTDKYTVGGLHIQFGKQYVFDDIFLLDIYAGIGYALVGYSTGNNSNSLYYDNYGSSNNYVFLRFDSSSPLSVSGGLRIGILF